MEVYSSNVYQIEGNLDLNVPAFIQDIFLESCLQLSVSTTLDMEDMLREVEFGIRDELRMALYDQYDCDPEELEDITDECLEVINYNDGFGIESDTCYSDVLNGAVDISAYSSVNWEGYILALSDIHRICVICEADGGLVLRNSPQYNLLFIQQSLGKQDRYIDWEFFSDSIQYGG